jgi:membrane-associated phospholipid phosphatase
MTHHTGGTHAARRPTRAGVGAQVLVVALAIAPNAFAQVTARTTGREVGHVFEDVGYVWGSPFHADRRDWVAAGAAAGGFVALLPLDAPIDRWIVDHPNAAVLEMLDPFREQGGVFNRLVTARRIIPISAALVLAGAVSGRQGLRDAGYGCIAGWGMSNTLRYTLYAGVGRKRPSVSEGNQYQFAVPGGDWDQQSFFAGHATNAFACASFWTERFDLGAAGPVLYVGAAMSALSRMADRRHWASDTFVGTVVGIAVGRTIASRYGRRDVKRVERERAPATPAPVVILWRSSF